MMAAAHGEIDRMMNKMEIREQQAAVLGKTAVATTKKATEDGSPADVVSRVAAYWEMHATDGRDRRDGKAEGDDFGRLGTIAEGPGGGKKECDGRKRRWMFRWSEDWRR